MKVSIVTPTYNNSKFIEETIISIKKQTYRSFEHIIVDGGSDDETPEIIERHRSSYSCRYIREKDNGMYDAINKGFNLSNGDILCWVNSDDLLESTALQHIVSIFSTHTNVDWLQGVSAYIDESGFITNSGKQLTYIRNLIKFGYYGRILHFVHQASGFWRRSLWMKAGGIDKRLKYAGDYELWIKFANFTQLYVTPVRLAYFRHHSNQLSKKQHAYYTECESVKHLTLFDRYFMKYTLKILHPVFAYRRNEIKG